MSYTAEEKAKEAEREVSYRKYVYANRVTLGKMTLVEASRRINIMQEIADDYRIAANVKRALQSELPL